MSSSPCSRCSILLLHGLRLAGHRLLVLLPVVQSATFEFDNVALPPSEVIYRKEGMYGDTDHSFVAIDLGLRLSYTSAAAGHLSGVVVVRVMVLDQKEADDIGQRCCFEH